MSENRKGSAWLRRGRKSEMETTQTSQQRDDRRFARTLVSPPSCGHGEYSNETVASRRPFLPVDRSLPTVPSCWSCVARVEGVGVAGRLDDVLLRIDWHAAPRADDLVPDCRKIQKTQGLPDRSSKLCTRLGSQERHG